MDPKAILMMTSIAFVVGIVSWALPAWKYHRQTKVGVFAGALLAAGIVFMSMFKWSEIALEVAGAKLQIKERDQKISALQTNLLKAQSALAQLEDKAPNTAVLASSIEDAMKKAGVVVDAKVVNTIATESLKPVAVFLDSPEWNQVKTPYWNSQGPLGNAPDTSTMPKGTPKPSGPAGSLAPKNLSPSFQPMVLPNKN
ncbi:MAG: hypothetical protein EOS10_31010 [Mesorhizobium sp.]|uniref:hypothetical protein n=1 Tax=Mesorhizobium sp. TaxID=1871066 RepID=UPI000FE632E1|nr:hypothetical protein [Mesorhizobium sp.]RWO25253.1 MAG: hypothetical protein EOS10_31010 [Mesorhizobium sp.]